MPLVSTDDTRGSMAVALALTIGVFELLLDAIPGIVLRLRTTLITSYFDHRTAHTWSPSALHDQQLGGAVLWCVAELIDLPFLLLVYLRWLRADERDAAQIDTVLEAERIAQGQQAGDDDDLGVCRPGLRAQFERVSVLDDQLEPPGFAPTARAWRILVSPRKTGSFWPKSERFCVK